MHPYESRVQRLRRSWRVALLPVLLLAACKQLFPPHPTIGRYAGSIPLKITNLSFAGIFDMDIVALPSSPPELLICDEAACVGCMSPGLEVNRTLEYSVKPGRYAVFKTAQPDLRRELEVRG